MISVKHKIYFLLKLYKKEDAIEKNSKAFLYITSIFNKNKKPKIEKLISDSNNIRVEEIAKYLKLVHENNLLNYKWVKNLIDKYYKDTKYLLSSWKDDKHHIENILEELKGLKLELLKIYELGTKIIKLCSNYDRRVPEALFQLLFEYDLNITAKTANHRKAFHYYLNIYLKN